MIYFVHRHVERIDEYRRFADDLVKFLRGKGSAELKPFLDGLEEIAQKIPQQYELQKRNYRYQPHDPVVRQQYQVQQTPGAIVAHMNRMRERSR